MPPWGLGSFSGGYRDPAPRRLTLEDLLGLDYQPTPRPEPARAIRDLEKEDRRRAQQQSVWAGLATLGAGISSGRWDRAAAGVGDIAALQQGAVDDANARAEAAWQEENAQRAAELQGEQRRQQAGALLGMYERVVDGEDPDGSFARRAEGAARAGSMAELEKLGAEKPLRAAARSKGYNPDAWDTTQRLQEELKAEIERANAAAAWEGERRRLEEREQLDANAELQSRIAQRDAGVLWEPPESPQQAAAREEALQRVRARYRETGAGGASGGRLYKQGERIVYATPPTAEDPDGGIIPLEGQPESVGETVYFNLPGGVRMAQRKDHPEWGAFEVPQPQPGEPGYEENRRRVLGLDRAAPARPAPAGPAAAPPPRIPGDPHPERPLQQRVADVEAAVGSLSPEERAQAAALLRTMLPRDVVAGIRRARAGR